MAEYCISVHLTPESLLVLQAALNTGIRYWPGGDAREQAVLFDIKRTIDAASLDLQLDWSE